MMVRLQRYGAPEMGDRALRRGNATGGADGGRSPDSAASRDGAALIPFPLIPWQKEFSYDLLRAIVQDDQDASADDGGK